MTRDKMSHSSSSFLTLGEFLSWAEKRFIKANIFFGHGTNNAWDEAVQLATVVLDLPANADASLKKRLLSEAEQQVLKVLVERRITERIPLPYLSNQAWFAGLKFYVNQNVIIPRSGFGELIQRKFQPWLGQTSIRRILDLCTGSGCMAIAAAMAFPQAQVDAVDISKAALEVAEKNVKTYKLEDRIDLLESDLFAACAGRQYDLIISNPPYVGPAEMRALPQEYLFEPTLALAAGDQGLEFGLKILKTAGEYLSPQGFLVLELGNSMETLFKRYPELPGILLECERGGSGIALFSVEMLKALKSI